MIKKVFRQMLLTQILSAMTVMICMLVDSIVIGRFLGVEAITAYGLANPILLVFAALGSMLSAGIQVVCGKTMGTGDSEGTDRCFSSSMFIAAVISGVGLILVLVFATPLCTLLGAGQPVEGNKVFFLTRDYLTGFIIGAPAFLCAMIMVPFMQMSGNRVRLVAAVAAMTVSDIVFDLVNVLIVKGGTLGMGLASSLSYYIAVIIGGSYFLTKKCMFRFKLKNVKRKVFFEVVKGGVPTMLNQVSLVLIVFLFNKILIEVGGNSAVASYSVISTIGNICTCFSAGIGSVALMLSSMFHSDEDRSSLVTVVKTMTFFAVVLNAVVIAVVLIFAPFLVRLFLADDPTVADTAALGIRLFVLSLIASSVNTAFKNYYQGVNRVGLTDVISVLQSLVFLAVYALILSRFFGTTGVWLAWICGEVTTLLFVCVNAWIRNRRVSFSASDFALLPPDFGSAPEECLDMTVRSVEEAVAASEKAQAFCLSRGEDARSSKLISLCVEEMANNVVEHGFTKDQKKDHLIEVRLMFKDGRRLIRFRDNCVNFDPVKYMDLHKTDDPTKHIGIRLVMKMVKDANYVSSLGLNNLTLVL